MLIDAHCHFFTKNIMTESITRLETMINGLERVAGKSKRLNERIGMNTFDFVQTAVQHDAIGFYNDMKHSYGQDFIAVPLMLDLSYTFLSPKDKSIEKKKSLAKALINLSEKGREANHFKTMHNFALNMEKSLDKYDRSVIVRDVFERSYEEQIHDLIGVKEVLGERVYPFFSVDPRREDEFEHGILGEIKKYVGEGKPFHGLKLYTSLGYSPTHPVLYDNSSGESVYGWLEENQIPVTIHSSIEGFSHMLDETYIEGDIYYPAAGLPVPSEQLYDDGIVKYDNNLRQLGFIELTAERLLTLNHPVLWEKVLKRYPKLKIDMAHFGGVIQMSKFAENDCTGFWPKYIIKLMEEYPNVYTDLSCYYNHTEDEDYLKHIYNNVYLKLPKSLRERVLYGSDYYMLKLYDTDLADYYEGFKEAFGDDFIDISEKNPRKFLDI